MFANPGGTVLLLDFCKMGIHSPLSLKERGTTRGALIAIAKVQYYIVLLFMFLDWATGN
jgi:hypothetical protein